MATVSRVFRRAFVLFLLAALLAAGWIGLNVAFPGFEPMGIPTSVLLMLFSNCVILYGLWRGLSRTAFSTSTKMALWLVIAVVFMSWMFLIWGLAESGYFRPRRGVFRFVPVLPLAILLPTLIGLGLLTRSKYIGSLLDAIPPSWLIGLQVYRVLGGIFLVNWARGDMPGAFALPAGIGDVAVGLLALPAALYAGTGTPAGRQIGVWWNLLGLADFAVAVGMGMMTSPGRFQVFAIDHPNALIGTFPTVMIPAFAVPSSILMHALSLRQLRRHDRGSSHVATSSPLGAPGLLPVS